MLNNMSFILRPRRGGPATRARSAHVIVKKTERRCLAGSLLGGSGRPETGAGEAGPGAAAQCRFAPDVCRVPPPVALQNSATIFPPWKDCIVVPAFAIHVLREFCTMAGEERPPFALSYLSETCLRCVSVRHWPPRPRNITTFGNLDRDIGAYLKSHIGAHTQIKTSPSVGQDAPMGGCVPFLHVQKLQEPKIEKCPMTLAKTPATDKVWA